MMKVHVCLAAMATLGCDVSLPEPPESPAAKTKTTAAKTIAPPTYEELLSKQFSEWDGSHKSLVAITKRAMHDANSFEHVTTGFKRLPDDTLFIKMEYRGANAFGAKVKNVTVGRFDLQGNQVPLLASMDEPEPAELTRRDRQIARRLAEARADPEAEATEVAGAVSEAEAAAFRKLNMAKKLLGVNDVAVARRMKEIIRSVPGTRAADQAKAVLDALTK